MAHSRIFQVCTEPIDEDDYLNEYDFMDNSFIGTVADYVDENTDRIDDIDWLISIFNGKVEYNEDKQTITLTTGFKEEYFRERFEALRELINTMTLVEFSGSWMGQYNINKLVEEKYKFYIWDVYEGYPVTLDDFIRRVECNVPYFIGKTIDYHW